MRNRLRILVVGLAALAGVLAFGGTPQVAKAGPPVRTECTPCATCDVVVGSKHVPLFPSPCPPPP